MEDFICSNCGLKGEASDFPDFVCSECDGEVVTPEKMQEIEAQAEEVRTRGKKDTEEWSKLIDEMNDDDF